MNVLLSRNFAPEIDSFLVLRVRNLLCEFW